MFPSNKAAIDIMPFHKVMPHADSANSFRLLPSPRCKWNKSLVLQTQPPFWFTPVDHVAVLHNQDERLGASLGFSWSESKISSIRVEKHACSNIIKCTMKKNAGGPGLEPGQFQPKPWLTKFVKEVITRCLIKDIDIVILWSFHSSLRT